MTNNNVQNPYFLLPLHFDPAKYYGPMQTVSQVLEAISGTYPAAVELSGLPGIGKTTIMRYLAHPEGAIKKHPDKLQENFREDPDRLFPVLVEFKHLPTTVHPFSYIHNRFHAAYSEFKERTGKPLPGLRPGFENHADNGDGIDKMEQELYELSRARIRPVFMMDDFDLAFERLTLAETTRLRPLRAFVSFVLGTERPLNIVNPEAAGSPFFSTLMVVRVTGLSSEETHNLLTKPAIDHKKKLPDKEVEFVAGLTGNHPYLLILAGKHLWELREQLGILDSSGTWLTDQQLNLLQGRFNVAFSAFFRLYLERLTSEELAVLKRISVSKEATIRSEEYFYLAALIGRAVVISDKPNQYKPFSPLFKEFLLSEGKGEVEEVEKVEEHFGGLEAKLYEYLRQNTERICTFPELSEEVWGVPYQEEDKDMRRRIQVTVSRIRSKLKESPTHSGEAILSMRDRGYKLVLPSNHSEL